jgi:hypothetical protein
MRLTSSDDNDPLRSSIYLLIFFNYYHFCFVIGLKRPLNPLAKPDIQVR